jgi:hypothetical protein
MIALIYNYYNLEKLNALAKIMSGKRLRRKLDN